MKLAKKQYDIPVICDRLTIYSATNISGSEHKLRTTSKPRMHLMIGQFVELICRRKRKID